MEQSGFTMTHVYGLTETYGPAVICSWKPQWDELPPDEQANTKARQGVPYHALEDLQIMNPETMDPVSSDAAEMGEAMFRGNIVMKGYLKNPKATKEAFADGWFHSGDLGVMHPDEYIQLKDRSKDIIISGGENISSIEIEDLLPPSGNPGGSGRRQSGRSLGRDPMCVCVLKGWLAGIRAGHRRLLQGAPCKLQGAGNRNLW